MSTGSRRRFASLTLAVALAGTLTLVVGAIPVQAAAVACTGAPGHKVEFRKSSIPLFDLAASDALFATSIDSTMVVARASDDGRPVINYSDASPNPTGPPTPTSIDSAALFSTTKGTFNEGEDDDFGMRSTGLLNITTPGVYTFTVGSDDGFRLQIGSPLEIVIQADELRPFSSTTGTKEFLTAGCYPYQLDFFERDGAAGVNFLASGPGITANSLVGGAGGIPVLDGVQPPPPPTTTSTTSTTLQPTTTSTIPPTTTSRVPVSTTPTSAPSIPTTTIARGGPSVPAQGPVDPLARTGNSVRGPLSLAALVLMLGNAALLWSSRPGVRSRNVPTGE